MSKTKIIVHMGFHKTGTTSLQTYLSRYRKALKPYCDIYIREQLGAATHRGRLYGQFPTIFRKILFKRAFAHFVNNISDAPVIVISREALSGIMIGQMQFGFLPLKRVGKNAAALAVIVETELLRRFGDEADITFLYTVREKTGWLKSTWGHVIKSSRVTLSMDEFIAKYEKAPDLDSEVAYILGHLKQVKVMMRRLEDYHDHPAGPAGAILELIGVPDDFAQTHKMKAKFYASEPPEVMEKFLEMNKTMRNNKQLELAKMALADQVLLENGMKPNRVKKAKTKTPLF